MSILQRLISWLSDKDPVVAPTDSHAAPPVPTGRMLNIGGGLYVLEPTEQLLADAERWNACIAKCPRRLATRKAG